MPSMMSLMMIFISVFPCLSIFMAVPLYLQNNLACQVCAKEFRSAIGLRKHFKEVHLGIQNYTCDVCGLKFSQSCSLSRHKKRRHGGPLLHICPNCGKRYAIRADLSQHMLSCAKPDSRWGCLFIPMYNQIWMMLCELTGHFCSDGPL